MIVEKFSTQQYDIFAGLDVHKKNIAATFLDHHGEIKQVNMPYNTEQLFKFVQNYYPDKRIAFVYESGPTGFGLYDTIISKGHYCMVTAPCQVPRIPGKRVKTDRIDSEKLSMNLRGGQLKGIIVPTPAYRELRHLVHLRDTFKKQVVATKLRIKSLLLLNGISFPNQDKENLWTRSVINQLKELPCSAPLRFNLNRLLASLEFFSANTIETTKAIRSYCKSDAAIYTNIGYLTSIPGIGFITASQLIARIGDPNHLKGYDQIGAFLGLVPREYSSGNEVHRGAITRTGHTNLRNKLIQCAWTAIRKDQELKDFYDAIYSRNRNSYGAKKAITAVARKLTTRIFAVLTEQRNYELRTSLKENGALPQGKDSVSLRTKSV